jgi:hypothetical protein
MVQAAVTMLEFNFACGALARLGVTWVSRNRGEVVMIVAVIVLLIYGYFMAKYAVYAVGSSDTSGHIRIARSILRGDIVGRLRN